MHNLRYRTSRIETNQTIPQTAGRQLYQPSFSRTQRTAATTMRKKLHLSLTDLPG